MISPDRPTPPAWRGQLRRLVPLAMIGAMAVIACLGYGTVYSGNGYLIHLIIAATGATLAARAADRFELLVGEAVVVSVVGFLVIGTLVTQWVPGASSPVDFVGALASGWADLLSSQTPTSLRGDRSVVPFTTAWVTCTVAHELVHRLRVPALALPAAGAGLVATSMFSTEADGLVRWQGSALLAATIVLGLLPRGGATRSAVTAADGRARGRRVLAPAVVLLLIGVLAATVAPRLPLAQAEERFDLRDLQDNPWDPLDVPSPLVTLKAELKKDDPAGIAFRVSSETALTRFPIAVLATYDGVIWQVADPQTYAPAQFVPVDFELPDSSDPVGARTPVTAEIEVVGLEGPWVPFAGAPREVRLNDDDELRLNLTTRTLAHPGGLEAGDRIRLTTGLRPDEIDLGQARFRADSGSTDVQFVPAPVLNLAADLVEGVDFGGPQVEAIRDLLTLQGFYDSGPTTPPGHSYARIASFIANPERIVGYEEQYAATAAVLARLASIPTRVTVGYTIDEGRYVDGTAEVHANDIAAWIEVRIEDAGWVAVDVTPDRSREPTEEEIGRVTRNVAVPNDPPPPPPPQQTEEDDEADEDEEEDEEDEDDNAADTGDGSLLSALAARPVLVAGTVAVSPFIIVGLLALLTFALKAWRRRRRRQAETARLQIAGAWAELIDRLEESGHVIERNATPFEIVAQLRGAPALAGADDELETLAELLSASAFSDREPDSADIERAWAQAEVAAGRATEGLSALERFRMTIDPRPLLRRGPREVTSR